MALKSERRRLAAQVESESLRLRLQVLEQELARMDELDAELADLRTCPALLEQREAELATIRDEVERLEASVVSLTVEASRAGPLGIALAGARSELEQSRMQIGRMRYELATTRLGKAHPPATNGASRAEQGGGRELYRPGSGRRTAAGSTKAAHSDDLKEIRGIGPVIERTLNRFGIHTWEQIADLTVADIERLSAALDTFPDRIERDDWIGGAKALLARGPGFRRSSTFGRSTAPA